MGMNQHLIRSIKAIREQGGVALKNGDRVMPDPILIGRNADKIEALAQAHGVARWGTDVTAALANPDDTVFFDAATTQMRPGLLTPGHRTPASTSIARSRSPPTWPTRWHLPPGAGQGHQARRGAGQAVPAGAAEAEDADRLGLLRPASCRCAASSATGSSKATCSPASGRRGTTAAKTAAASSSTCCATGATCSTTCSARSVGVLPGCHAHPAALGRAGQAYAATADDAAYATFELDGKSGER
jgi:hypothetical protein